VQEKDLGIVVGTIISAEKVVGSERLHRIVVDVGDRTVQIASGIAGDFPSGYLIGKQVPVCIDVKRVKVRGVESEARFLATNDDEKRPVLLHPERPVPPGTSVW